MFCGPMRLQSCMARARIRNFEAHVQPLACLSQYYFTSLNRVLMNLFDQIQSQISDDMIAQLSKQVGGTPEQTRTAANGAISTLVSGLSKNASRPGGAESLLSALDRDHDGSVLDDAMGFLLGSKQPASQKALNGSGIVKHVLGGRQDAANDMLGKMSGLKSDQMAQVMKTLAPLVMAALGKAKRKEDLNAGGIGELLSRTVQSSANQRNELGLIGRFLDKDDDGSVMDDIVDMGMKAFFKRK